MARANNTGSTLTLPNGNNKTSTSLSTHMIILVDKTPVGAIGSMQISERRDVRMIHEVGTDGNIDSTPTKPVEYQLTIQRTRFDRLRGTEAFGRGFMHLASQRYPFDIAIIDRQKQDVANHITTIIKNVWFTSMSHTLKADDWIIVDDISATAEFIYSYLPGGAPAAAGGEINIPFFTDTIERAADVGQRRGALDASGLIDLSGNLF